jgi:hypothetical protein
MMGVMQARVLVRVVPSLLCAGNTSWLLSSRFTVWFSDADPGLFDNAAYMTST